MFFDSFRKKNTDLMFFQSYLFSWKTNKLDPKLTKTDKNMCLRHIKNFRQKKTQFEYSKVCESE